MIARQIKIAFWGALTFSGILLEYIGINKMATSLLAGRGMHGIGLVIGGLLLGIPSAIIWQFLRAKPDTSLDKEKIATETLAKLAEDDRRDPTKRQ